MKRLGTYSAVALLFASQVSAQIAQWTSDLVNQDLQLEFQFYGAQFTSCDQQTMGGPSSMAASVKCFNAIGSASVAPSTCPGECQTMFSLWGQACANEFFTVRINNLNEWAANYTAGRVPDPTSIAYLAGLLTIIDRAFGQQPPDYPNLLNAVSPSTAKALSQEAAFEASWLQACVLGSSLPANQVPGQLSATQPGRGSPFLSPINGSPPLSNSNNAPPSTNVGAIVGGVLGALVILIVGTVAGLLLWRRRRRTYDSQKMNGHVAGGTNDSMRNTSIELGRLQEPALASLPPPEFWKSIVDDGQGSGDEALNEDPLLRHIRSTLAQPSATSRGPLGEWELRFNDIQMEGLVGEGSWGRVYKGKWNQTQVAVKVLIEGANDVGGVLDSGESSRTLPAGSNVKARLEQEASLMTQLHHPNIVQFLGITTKPAAVVTEFCSRGNLTGVLHVARSSPEVAAELTWTRRISFAADCARGMIYLHTRAPPVLHRDLKSANLLVTSSWTVKVSDFNLSKVMHDSSRSTSLQAMNPRWLPPEVLSGGNFTMAADVFAFGVILWELTTWELPWGCANPWGIVGSVSRGERLSIPAASELPGSGSAEWPQLPQYTSLMQRCWAQDPAERPTFEEIMNELQLIDPSVA